MNMKEYRKLWLAAAFVLLAAAMSAQEPAQKDSVRLSKWEPHLSVSSGFMGTSWGDNRLYTSVAPSLTYRPNERWSFDGGFRITSDMGLSREFNLSPAPQDLAPYRERNGGTGLVSAHLSAQYQVNDNMWLAASIYHLGGSYAPMYGPWGGSTFDVSATAISAEAAFRFKEDNFLTVSFTYIHDNCGTMPLMLHDMWMHHPYGQWGMYMSPADYYRMADPYSPMYYGAW